ncbi:HNH endonuclease [Candidatus Reidiella endopervernicosa]|uniref:HNH endonuclease n=1 Tax=Candidatus Reidiella endopervernicosa TaxID=2738883 RepID=A0A6N0HVJ0_9GAMM|nr:HNH endonuclease [Candidatus Reidiella endopervernicosa]QKQ26432.1 HNH endonuclease [Candidatus Reidiella endopervernicosa]
MELIKIEGGVKNIPIFQQRNSTGKGMCSCALKTFIEYRKSEFTEELEQDIEHIIIDDSISATEKTVYINARVGQGRYRRELIGRWKACALSGFRDTRLLVASHIKPWNASSNKERLDSFNGLLLLPNLDKVFDLGFITFENSGRIIISDYLEEISNLGIQPDMQVILEAPHQKYIQYHRDVVLRVRFNCAGQIKGSLPVIHQMTVLSSCQIRLVS